VDDCAVTFLLAVFCCVKIFVDIVRSLCMPFMCVCMPVVCLFTSTTGSPMVTHCGQILVPSACAAFLVVDFINSHASEARRIRQEFERLLSVVHIIFF